MLLAVVALTFTFVTASTNSDDPAVGVWLSVADDGVTPTGYWKLYVAENGTLFGEMIYAIEEALDETLSLCDESYRDYPVEGNVSEMPLLGTTLMYNLNFKKEGEWIRGNIIDPDDGKIYYVRVKVEGDKMTMRGSIDKAGWLGRSQTWRRTTMERAIESRDNLETKAQAATMHDM